MLAEMILLRLEKGFDSTLEVRFISSKNLTLPQIQDSPTSAIKCSSSSGIAASVTLQFINPILPPCLWDSAPPTAVHMPEATANVDDLLKSRKNEIGGAR